MPHKTHPAFVINPTIMIAGLITMISDSQRDDAMTQESIVYGCIKDIVYTDDKGEALQRREINRQVLQSLPSSEEWPPISREMFAVPGNAIIVDDLHTDVEIGRAHV